MLGPQNGDGGGGWKPQTQVSQCSTSKGQLYFNSVSLGPARETHPPLSRGVRLQAAAVSSSQIVLIINKCLFLAPKGREFPIPPPSSQGGGALFYYQQG